MAGFSFGSTPSAALTTTSASTPFSFGITKTTAPTLNFGTPSTTAGTGTGAFSFGLNKPAAAPGLLATPASTAASTGFGGFGLGQTQTTTATTASTGFSFSGGAATATTTAAPSLGLGGFSFNKPATTTAGFSLGAPTTSAPGLGGTTGLGGATGLGGGLFSGAGLGTASTAGTSTAGTSIFSSIATSTTNVGLGGLDPNTALKQGSSGSSSAASDGKTLKESILPEQLTSTVDSLQKYVKEEKNVREDIARMSSKPMMKVQEDVTALRQLLSVVATGLQRNACSVEKLKLEMTQKLKNAEMAQRTKDIPAGLQYENTAPTEYFQRLVEEFEERMVTYRQQIETLDSHLAAQHEVNARSPAEVFALLKKLHETFISLAAQLQQVHEAVKNQKDQFLTYRRVFHGDSKNVFHKPGPPPKVTKKTQLSDLSGPSPFTGTSNAAATAMAMVHIRAQQPQGPPVTGLVGGTQAGFGSSPFTGGLFGAAKPAVGGLGLSDTTANIGGVGNLFSSTSLLSTPQSGGFGTPPTLGSSTTAALNLAGTNLNSAGTKQPFQLQKPPQGAKRGKR